ncbi:DUF4253 domain-containing protein [Streptomyces sp. NPDC086023]|uniref:DUF4253 domain-containing protein n=1 Tax=Streptomyces sp. NPDC086023 TaxID=3365746 RepID=UPI0037D1D3C7
MTTTDTVVSSMVAAGLVAPGAAAHSARLPGGVVVHGVRVAQEHAERAWHFWRGRAGVVPLLTTRVTSAQDLTALASAAAEAGPPAESVPVAEASGTVARIVSRVGARSIAEAYPEDRAEEEELRDPARLVQLLDPPSGSAVAGNPLAFTPDWGIENLWLLLVEEGGGGGESHRLPLLLPGFLSGSSTAWPDMCPLTPAEHSAFLRHWNARYGAEVFFMGGTEMQLYVPRPPLDLPAIAALAIEQNAYCDDLDDVIDTANGQARSTVWHFWWD